MSSRTLQTARLLTEAGFSILPTKPDTKEPALSSWKFLQAEHATENQMQEWFRNGNGLAVIAGKISGNLEILDFDEPGLYEKFEQACVDNGVLAFENGCLFKTPRGGAHLWIRSSRPVGANKKLARDETGKVLIETRGEGGYACTYPTPGYKLIRGRPDSLTVLTQEAVEHLHSIAAIFEAYEPPNSYSASENVTQGQTDGVSPGAAYNESGDYESLLEKHGWKRLHRWNNRTTWLRPGKVGHGISATTGWQGTRMLYCFTTNAPPFESERKYDPFGVYARLEHGGVFKEAASALYKEGYGDRRTRTKAKATVEEKEETTAEIASDEFSLATAWAEESKDKFCYAEGDQWFRYDAGRWSYTGSERICRSVQEFMVKILPAGKVTSSKVFNVYRLGSRMVGPKDISEFNAHPHLIPLRNGVFDTRAAQLIPHSPGLYLTHQAGYEYVPNMDCPVWKRCLEEWLVDEANFPLPAWIALLQEWYGYCLIPDNAAQVSLFWLGEGANGKGTATRALRSLMGIEAVVNIPIEQLHDPYHRADIAGKLLGLVNEPDRRAMQKNGNWFKALTGGDDLISARRPGEKVFNFLPTCRIVVSCNEMPATNDPSLAYFRRIIPIEWRYNVAPDKRDPSLDDKIALEMPGIFNWAMIGLSRLKARNRRFEMPEESQRLLETYKTSQDTLFQFLEDQCDTPKDASAWISNGGFYKAYSGWCETFKTNRLPATIIAKRMPKLGFSSTKRRVLSALQRGWQGVCIKEDLEEV